MISLSGLNDNQREAASSIEGPVLILAGAGSGKTRTITYRMAHMVDNLHIPSKNILAVSFTNKAAREMRERMQSILGKTKCKGLTLSTFHSLGVKILKKEITHLGYHKNFSIYDTTDQLSIIREALKSYRAEKQFDKKIIQSKIGYLKNNGIDENEYKESKYFDPEDPYDIATEYCYQYYEDKLHFYNAIDFDDILFLTVKLFNKFPEIAKKYSEKFQYIMVDEYQDTNTLQYQLIRALTSTHDNLCVVGDDDQSIYSFRGANIQNILDFEYHYPQAKIVKLEENYRSTSPILNLANNVIKHNKDRRDKTLWSKKESLDIPELWAMADTDHESQIIVDDILKFWKDDGYLADVAILYRSNNQAQPIEDELRISQIPYTIIGGQKFYEKKEIKDLMAYLTFLINPEDQLALRRIINIPHRGIGTVTLNKYLKKAEEKNIHLYECFQKYADLEPSREKHITQFCDLINDFKFEFKTNTLPEALSTMIEKLNFISFIEKSYDSAKQVDRRRNDVYMFIESAERFRKFNHEHATLKNFVEKLILQDSQDNKDLEEEEDDDVRKNEVTLMTLHSSKGLEFKKVYLVGVEEETLPHKKSILDGDGIPEERRLCYVGMTRAQEKLIMTYCKERMLYGKKTPRKKSRFISDNEAIPFYKEIDRQNFGHLSEDEAKEYKKTFFSNLLENLD